MDLTVTAYPKSGITWCIHLLSDLLDLTQHDNPDAEIQGYWGDNGDNGIIRKSHNYNLGQFANKQVVYLQRDPRDVLVSTMCYLQADFDSTLFALAVFYEDYISSWLTSYHLTTRYEWLHDHPEIELGRIAYALTGAYPSEDKIKLAIERQSFENMRAQINDDHFMRLGKVGDWRNHFSREQGQKFNDILGEFMLRQGYIDSLDWWQEL